MDLDGVVRPVGAVVQGDDFCLLLPALGAENPQHFPEKILISGAVVQAQLRIDAALLQAVIGDGRSSGKFGPQPAQVILRLAAGHRGLNRGFGWVGVLNQDLSRLRLWGGTGLIKGQLRGVGPGAVLNAALGQDLA